MFELKVIKEETINSELYKSDGVSIVLKPLTTQLRAKIELECAKERGMVLDLQIEGEDLRASIDTWLTANLAPNAKDLQEGITIPENIQSATRRMVDIREQIAILQNGFIYPMWIKGAVKKVTGVSKDGQSATPQDLSEMAPIDMIEELGKAITNRVYLSAEVQQNLESPTTSSAVDGGQNHTTTATPVSAMVAPPQEIVANIFQKISDSQDTCGSLASGTAT